MARLCKNLMSLQLAHVVRLKNVLRQAMSNISAHSLSPMPSTQCQCALKNKPYVVTSKLSSLVRSMMLQAPSLPPQWVMVTLALTRFCLQREHQHSKLSIQLQSLQTISRSHSWSTRLPKSSRLRASYQEPVLQLMKRQILVYQREVKPSRTLAAREILTRVTKRSHQEERLME